MKAWPVAADRVQELRGRILRPGQEPAAARFDGDEDPRALHVAILRDGEPVAVASVIPEGGPGRWRIRGMATEPALRRRGMGAALLAALEQHARARDGAVLWCNARLAARALYERAGMRAQGEPFPLPGIGEHVLMCKRLVR